MHMEVLLRRYGSQMADDGLLVHLVGQPLRSGARDEHAAGIRCRRLHDHPVVEQDARLQQEKQSQEYQGDQERRLDCSLAVRSPAQPLRAVRQDTANGIST